MTSGMTNDKDDSGLSDRSILIWVTLLVLLNGTVLIVLVVASIWFITSDRKSDTQRKLNAIQLRVDWLSNDVITLQTASILHEAFKRIDESSDEIKKEREAALRKSTAHNQQLTKETQQQRKDLNESLLAPDPSPD